MNAKKFVAPVLASAAVATALGGLAYKTYKDRVNPSDETIMSAVAMCEGPRMDSPTQAHFDANGTARVNMRTENGINITCTHTPAAQPNPAYPEREPAGESTVVNFVKTFPSQTGPSAKVSYSVTYQGPGAPSTESVEINGGRGGYVYVTSNSGNLSGTDDLDSTTLRLVSRLLTSDPRQHAAPVREGMQALGNRARSFGNDSGPVVGG